MNENDIIVGKLVGFTYVGRETKYCRITVEDKDGNQHKGIAGTADLFPFATMLSLKGAGAQLQMVYKGQNEEGYDRYSDVEFKL